MTWCLEQGTEETVVYMDGICAGNWSGVWLEATFYVFIFIQLYINIKNIETASVTAIYTIL